MRVHLLITCGAALAMPAIVFAQDDAKRPGRAALFARLDENKDGTLTKEEIPEERQRLFNRLIDSSDKDKDGKLSRDEFIAGLQDDGPNRPSPDSRPTPRGGGPDQRPGPQMMAGMAIFRALDADGDGKLSAGEIEKAAAALKRLDKNSDGQLTGDEIGPAGGGGVLAGGGRGIGGGAGMLERLRELDKNNDGKWSKEELPPRLAERFDALDANKDGAVDRQEIREAGGRFGRRGGEPATRGAPGKTRPEGRRAGRSDGSGSAPKKTD